MLTDRAGVTEAPNLTDSVYYLYNNTGNTWSGKTEV